eukprot:gnl/TRDRNA2_/TRDRNA2_202455_c0_seq1.p1 gnl/TRDRNA2_/TRDRNA2_202455_c0~~gnl/TRDRNA2_/TRDRNA2_202455_c0_seq1.p1  ORF type:complete len:324 (+),score=50.89 gnl/TRDRNA2_/TRDRNA2_202455_c0_seq1:64-1035(+)
MLRVKNTFLDVADESEQKEGSLVRSKSDSDLCSSSSSQQSYRPVGLPLTRLGASEFHPQDADGQHSSSSSRAKQPSQGSRDASSRAGSGSQSRHSERSKQDDEELSPRLAHKGEVAGDFWPDTLDVANELDPALPSKGSLYHDLGNCKPCMWVTSKTSCYQGKDCNLCHIPHSKTNRRSRPSKNKRKEMKKTAQGLEAMLAEDPERFAQTAGRMASGSRYLHTVLRGKMKDLEEDDVRITGQGGSRSSALPAPGQGSSASGSSASSRSGALAVPAASSSGYAMLGPRQGASASSSSGALPVPAARSSGRVPLEPRKGGTRVSL